MRSQTDRVLVKVDHRVCTVARRQGSSPAQQLACSRRPRLGRTPASRGSGRAGANCRWRPPGRHWPPIRRSSVDAAAGAFDDRDQRDDVVGLQPGLDDQVDMARGDHAIGVAIAAVAGSRTALSTRSIGVAVARRRAGLCGEQRRVGECGQAASQGPLAAGPRVPGAACSRRKSARR